MKYITMLGLRIVAAYASDPVVVCPPPGGLNNARSKTMTQELQNAGPQTLRFRQDYASLRKQVRACQRQ